MRAIADVYILVINLNGTIEFILDNDKDVTNNDMIKLLDKCNEFVVNKQTMYSLDSHNYLI